MKEKIIKIVIECTPVENYLKEVHHTFVFKGEYFDNCETIEEVRDKFYEGLRKDYVLEYIHIYIFLDQDRYKNDEFIEYLGE